MAIHDEYLEFLTFGDQIIEETEALILSLWHSKRIASELKEDNTPVSEVDLRCEELVRSAIRKSFPSHGVIGEEHGDENTGAEYVWTIDPIDGTQNLVNRIPTFGTILALLHRGEPILGWINHPVLKTRVRGGQHIGVTCNSEVILLADLPNGVLTHNDIVGTNCPSTFERGGNIDVMYTVLRTHPHVRMYYDVYSHSLAILGSLAAMVEYNLKIWDVAASRALISGVGGMYLELGVVHHEEGPTTYNAVFGKPSAVKIVGESILRERSA